LAARDGGTGRDGGEGHTPAQGPRGRGRQPVRPGRVRRTRRSGPGLGSGAAWGAVARQDLPFSAVPRRGTRVGEPSTPFGAGAVVSRHGCDTDAGDGSAP